jgi:hypothetical protein
VTTGTSVLPIRPAQGWRRVGLILLMLVGAALLAWAGSLIEQGQGARAGLALLGLLPLLVVAAWPCGSEGRLLRDAGVWFFEGPAPGAGRQAGELVVSVDLGDWMLLQFRSGGARWGAGRRWLTLSRRDMPADWQAFRRAVYSPRPSPAGLSAQAPADPPA